MESQTKLLQLNLGCGFKKKEGFINVDYSEGTSPDVCIDLATQKWPWENNSVSRIEFEFSLEQMGDNKSHLFHILKEVYRVCASKAVVFVRAVHPRHDQFYLNPLCVHRLSPDFFRLLSKSQNLSMIANGELDTSLALQLDVDFTVAEAKHYLSAQFQEAFEKGQITAEELNERMIFQNNICHVMDIEMRVNK